MAHVVNVTTRTQVEGDYTVSKWLTKCTCGWAGPPRSRQVIAQSDGQGHVDRNDGRWGEVAV